MQHSAQCRARIEAELAQTERGKARLEHVKGRLDRSAAEIGEAVVALAAAGAADARPEGEMVVPQFPRFEKLGGQDARSFGRGERAPHDGQYARSEPHGVPTRRDEGVRGARRVPAGEPGHGETSTRI